MRRTLNISIIILSIISFISCNGERKNFNDAKKANTIEALKEFAINYPNSEYADSARCIIDNIIWQQVVSKDSIKTYQKFIAEYPGNMFADSAKAIVDNYMWQSVKTSNTVEDYESFVEEYPDSRFIDSAKVMIEKQKTE